MKNSYQFLTKLGFGLVTMLTSLLLACSNPGKSGSTDTPKAPELNRSNADAKPVAPIQAETGSRIIVTFKNPTELKNLSGYVVDASDEHGFKAVEGSSGRYALYSMKPGRYDVIFAGQRANDDPAQTALTSVGLRLSGITVKAGEDLTIKEPVDLLPSFAIKGKVRLQDGLTHGAIEIQIPGTKIKTTTTADGSFSLENVPTGNHSVQAISSGFSRGFYETRTWPQAENTLTPLTLLAEDQALATGVHYKGSGLFASEANQVTVFLVHPASMNKYRLSETSDFAESVWLNFQSSVDLSFPIGGERKVYVQFSKDEQQFSAIFSADLPIAASP